MPSVGATPADGVPSITPPASSSIATPNIPSISRPGGGVAQVKAPVNGAEAAQGPVDTLGEICDSYGSNCVYNPNFEGYIYDDKTLSDRNAALLDEQNVKLGKQAEQERVQAEKDALRALIASGQGHIPAAQLKKSMTEIGKFSATLPPSSRLKMYQNLRTGIENGLINQQDILKLGKGAAYYNELSSLKITDDKRRIKLSASGVGPEMGAVTQGIVGTIDDLANSRTFITGSSHGDHQGLRVVRDRGVTDYGLDTALYFIGGIGLARSLGKLGVDAVAGAGLRSGKGLASLGEEEAGALGRALCKFNSFSSETPVMTKLGLAPIGTLTLGQDVLAYNEAKGQNEYQPIQQVFINQDPQITFLQVDQELVTTTPEHPFYVNERSDTEARPKPIGHGDLNEQWVGAGHLKIGDKIQKADGGFGVVKYVNTVEQTRTMYNLEVKEAHTFFVGTGGWLVHNCDPWERRVTLRKGTKEEVQKNAPKTNSGEYIDPNTGQVIPKDSRFDYGHKPGYEWRTTQQKAKDEGWTRKQVIEYENDPNHYQIEDPSANRSHKYEKKP